MQWGICQLGAGWAEVGWRAIVDFDLVALGWEGGEVAGFPPKIPTRPKDAPWPFARPDTLAARPPRGPFREAATLSLAAFLFTPSGCLMGGPYMV